MLNDEDKFQGYEFEKGEAIDIPVPFLFDLRSTLHKFGLEKYIALDVFGGPGNRSSPRSLEYAIGEIATVTIPGGSLEESHRITGVAFCDDDGTIGPRNMDGYVKNIRGTHQVFYDKNLGSRLTCEEGGLDIGAAEVRSLLRENGISI
jgi:hypothetical protein